MRMHAIERVIVLEATAIPVTLVFIFTFFETEPDTSNRKAGKI